MGAAGYVVAGRAMDRWGRRPTLVLYQAVGALFGASAFQLDAFAVLVPVLVVGIFFGLGGGAVTGALSTELFPTEVRGRAAAWARNAFEIPGAILGPLIVGYLGDQRTGAIGSIGDSASLIIAAAALPVLLLTLLSIPETRGVDLSALGRERR
jgi:putative MFS transporter